MRYVLIFVLTVFLLSGCDDGSISEAPEPDTKVWILLCYLEGL